MTDWRAIIVTVVLTTGVCYSIWGSPTTAHEMSPVQKQVQHERLVSELNALRSDVKEMKPRPQDFPATKTLSSSSRKRILVTGGAGFVGSNLVDKLMREGNHVIVMDNFFTGRMENIIHWVGHPNFALVEHDVTDKISFVVDQIYHMASPASPPHYMFDPMKTILTNTDGTRNMLEIARATGARVLFTSTSEVYGDPKVHPQPETYWGNVNPIGPRACYDEAKRLGETMMYAYQSQYHVDVRVVRIFNTFGPRMHPNDGRVVSNFIINALQGRDITIYGEGQQTRSFQFVDDLVDGIYTVMNGDVTTPVNVGNPDEYTVARFAELIKELTATSSKIVKKEASKDDPSQRKPDITKAKEKLGWKPKWTVSDGLVKTIEYFKQQLEKNGGRIDTVGQEPKRPGYLKGQ
eukprot:TRINITY_DN562_c0_g2_i1.p1 TRINITY_DN562_c0_g2~~TRINITY_DN562_c0_g2_i1.p1  ORF type:complete len:438 (+),score=172.89 TRINITY_DN562_c0_g2_i1:98-1315(+)